VAQLPELSRDSSDFYSIARSHAAIPRAKASLGFQGKFLSLIMYMWRRSRRKSATAAPPCPSYTPKNDHFGQASFSGRLFDFTMFNKTQTRSSLYSRTRPRLVLTAYALTIPFCFSEHRLEPPVVRSVAKLNRSVCVSGGDLADTPADGTD
jgi:hypothetical protein